MGALGKPNSVTVGVGASFSWMCLIHPPLDSVYRLPVQSPSMTAKEVKSRALDLQLVLEDVQVKHPLVRVGFFSKDA